jgi:hypothetical protein
MITHKELAERVSYDPDTGILRWKVKPAQRVKIGDAIGTKNSKGYLTSWQQGKAYQTHRLIWLLMKGEWPKGQIDHINGNKADNRWCNLREATQAQNLMNRLRLGRGTSRAAGVYWSKRENKWKAQCSNKYLGTFLVEADAIDAVIAYRRQHFPEWSTRVIAELEQLKEAK